MMFGSIVNFAIFIGFLVSLSSCARISDVDNINRRPIDVTNTNITGQKLDHTYYMLDENEQIVPFDDSGNMADGSWYCPGRVWPWSDCPDGDFICDWSCPEGGKGRFHVPCNNEGFIGWVCGTPDIGYNDGKLYNCDRYKQCSECTSSYIGYNSRKSCIDCLDGFYLEPGDCTTDIDECEESKDDCEHCCINTYGSYYCECMDGFSLRSDQRTCDQDRCDDPGNFHNHGVVTFTDDMKQNSYATFECQPPYILVGQFYKQCVGRPGADVTPTGWEDYLPTCMDKCDDPELIDQEICGWDGIDGKACFQMGCCFDTGSMTCRQKPGKVYSLFSGEKANIAAIQIFSRHNEQSCSHECDKNRDCQAYSIERIHQSDGLVSMNCHLLDKSRTQLFEEGSIVADDNFDIFHVIVLNIGDGDSSDDDDQENKKVHKLYEECFHHNMSTPDLAFHVLTDNRSMSASKCMDTCRQQTFKFAGVMNGTDCYCGSRRARNSGISRECHVTCPGDSKQICGGPSSMSIYIVDIDHRYIGCYQDDPANPDLPIKVTDSDGNSVKLTAKQCITQCAEKGLKFAGVQNGGECTCGDEYGSHGGVIEFNCSFPCGTHGRQNCGGNITNAMYTTELAYDIMNNVAPTATKIFSTDSNLLTLDMNIFTIYLGLRSYVSSRLILYSSEPVSIIQKDPSCSEDCYKPCGNIMHLVGLADAGDDVVLRFFFFRLSDLHKYVGTDPQRVYIYAQTLVIDADLNVGYSILMRARQILMDRSKASNIKVSPTAPELGVDLDLIKRQGPFPELMHQRQSYMCARILLETKLMADSNIAFAILHEISFSPRQGHEQASFAGMVRSFAAAMSGIHRADVHFVPTYTQAYLKDMMEGYLNTLKDYYFEMEKLSDAAITHTELVAVVEKMAAIYIDTNIEQTKIQLEKALQDITSSLATYDQQQIHYDKSLEAMALAQWHFEQGVADYQEKMRRQALFGFVSGIYKVVEGLWNTDWDDIAELKFIDDLVWDDDPSFEDIYNTFKDINDMMKTMKGWAEQADELYGFMQDLDYEFDTDTYIEDIEDLTSITENQEQWANMKDQADMIIRDSTVQQIGGALDYARTIMDTANWGSSLSEAMIDYSELNRYAMEKRAALDAKFEQKKKMEELIEKLRNDISHKAAAMVAVNEQTYDVRCDLNEALLQYCQAYFYENLEHCSEENKPDFGDELFDLLMKVLAVMSDLPGGNPPSTIHIIVKIKDTDLRPECQDSKLCPVNYLRKYGILKYDLPADHNEFAELHKCRAAEIQLRVPEATSPDPNRSTLSMTVQTSGTFYGRFGPDVYTFMTRALSLQYAYDIKTGDVTTPAIIYNHHSNVFNHVTPYTEWVMYLNQTGSTVDLSTVQEVHLHVIGMGLVMYSVGHGELHAGNTTTVKKTETESNIQVIYTAPPSDENAALWVVSEDLQQLKQQLLEQKAKQQSVQYGE